MSVVSITLLSNEVSKKVSIMSKLLTTLNLWLVILCCVSCTAGDDNSHHGFYRVKPLKIGVEVFGIDLKAEVPDEVIAQIKHDATKYRLMVFRDQGIVSGDRHVEITRWFGKVDTTFISHRRSPHPDVLRVSNDENEGSYGIGRSGWHIDGTHQIAPYSFALYHIWSAPKQGDTVFVPLTEVIESLSPETYQRWDRLWMVNQHRRDRRHPFIYSHPLTGKKVLCFHLGFIQFFVWDHGTVDERETDAMETKAIKQEIHEEIVKNDSFMIYSHKWTAGDFIISDNLALGHEASPETQLPREEVGLRVMHRTTAKGIRPPKKEWLNDHSLKSVHLSDEL